MHTIKRAAELTGVPAATLRAWERRYALVEPERTETGYRLYDDVALARIRTMAALIAEGWSAGTAAAETRRRDLDTPASDGRDATRRLVDAAATMDTVEVTRVLDERFALASFESVVDDWLMPTLEQIGRSWADGQVSVAGEHLVAHAVLRRLAAAFDAATRRPGGPRALVGLPAGAHHELGVFAFAVALRRLGVDVTYLGADLPAAAWREALGRHAARCVVLSVPRPEDLPAAREAVATLTGEDVRVFVGGARQEDLDDAAVTPVGHPIAPAAARVAAALAAPA